MQCKDIPDQPILDWLRANTSDYVWATWFDAFPDGMRSVQECMPPETPPKLRLAKMRMLIHRGLVEGCGCGCRGDFHIKRENES